MQEFINLQQGGLSVKEYAIKFTQLSKYALTLAVNSRAKMNKCAMGVSYLVVNESRLAIPFMYNSCLMFYVNKLRNKSYVTKS